MNSAEIELVKLIAEVGFPIVCSGVVIILALSMFRKQQEWLEKFITGKLSKHPSTEDVEVLEVINNKIYQEIRGVLNALEADRSFVFLYHNGGVSSSGLYFQKMSCICEVVSEGILPVASQRQNLHRVSYSLLCDTLKRDGYASFPDAQLLKGQDNYIYQELVCRHSRASYFRALRDSQNNVIGFIGIDYCSENEKRESEIMKLLSTVSHKVAPLIDIRDEVTP